MNRKITFCYLYTLYNLFRDRHENSLDDKLINKWIERSKDQHLSEIKSFCNITHYTIQKLGVGIIFILFGKEII